MKSSAHISEQRVNQFKEACRNAGIKVTHQRLEIFNEVANSREHPDAETVYRGVRERMPTVSLDTVYRTLWMLTDLGLITTLSSHRDRARFDANIGQHHHFVCTRCGLVRDFNSDEFNDLKVPTEVKTLGQIETTHVEVRGICETCSKDSTENSVPRNPQPPKGKKGK